MNEIAGRPIVDVLGPEAFEALWQYFIRVLAGQKATCEKEVNFSGIGRRWISATYTPTLDANGVANGWVAVVIDITEKKQAEAAVRESEECFRLLANTAPVVIWMTGTDKLCTYLNQRWVEFSGRPAEEGFGHGWLQDIHPEDRERCWDAYERAFDQRRPFQMEYRFRRHDGEYRWILGSGVPRFIPDGSFAGYIGSTIDITDRRVAEEALSKVGQRLIEAHEEERTRIARELHDDINQRLALLAVNLEGLEQNLPSSAAELQREIGNIVKQLQELGGDVQAISHQLHPSKLEYLGLASAAAAFCRELSRRPDVQVDFHSENVPKNLPKDVSLSLFRVLQESLQNAIKHSGSRQFQVSLGAADGQIELIVRDSGVGFDPKEAMRGEGLGLTSMLERLKLVNGTLSIDSRPHLGTTICARVPIAFTMKSAATAA